MNKLLCFILALFPLLGWGQVDSNYTQRVRGIVIDKLTKTTLPGATLLISNIKPVIGTTSNINGEFTFESVPVGRISIQVNYLGYEPYIAQNIDITMGKEKVLTIELTEVAFEMNQMVVTVKTEKEKAINEMASSSVRTFSVEETERFAGSLGDPSRMASNFAGVAMVNDSRNDIIIRGNSPSGVLWRLNGFEIPNPNHFGAMGTTGGPVSILNNKLLTNSDFFTGAFPAEYGNAMSGVFDLRMRSGNNKKTEFVGQVGFNGFELGAEGPFSKKSNSSYLINYRYSTLGLMNNIGFDFGTGTAVPQYQDITFKVDLPTQKLGKFTLLGMGGISYIELHDSKLAANDSGNDNNYDMAGADLDFGAKFGMMGLAHTYYFSQNTRLETQLSIIGTQNTTAIDSLQYDTEGHIIPNSNYKYYDAINNEVKYAFAMHLRSKVNARNNYVLGGYLDTYHVNFIDSARQTSANESIFIQRYNAKGSIYVPRLYFQWQHLASKKLTFNGGIYTQYDFQSSAASIEPRLGASYTLSRNKTIGFAYGLHSQTQPRFYYFMQSQQPDGSYLRTNENIGLSKSQQIVLSYDQKLNANFRLKFETYFQHLFQIPVTANLPQFSMINTGDSFEGVYPDSLVNNGTGTNYGVELTLEKFLSHNFYFLSTLSLYESKYTDYNHTERNSAFNGNYVFNILGGYEYQVNNMVSFTADARVVYAGGKRYIPINLEESQKANETVYDWDRAYEDKYDDYFRTDFRLGVKMNGKKIHQEFAVDFQNITNSQNIFSQAYNPRTKGLSTRYQTGFYPMFLFRIIW